MVAVAANFADPKENLKVLDIAPGARVADFGAGSGAYSFAAAALVGREGKVYAVEVQKELVDTLASAAIEQGFSNIEAFWGDLNRVGGSHIAEASIDAVIISNILFQSEDKRSIAQEALRILKPGGTALVIDWSGSFGGLGPSAAAVVNATQGKSLFIEAGFELVGECNAGAQHWGIIMRKP